MSYTAPALFYKNGKGEKYEEITATGTLVAGCFVTYADGPAGAGAVVKGIAQSDAVSGDRVVIVVEALETAVLAGAAVAIGAAISSNGSGKAITSATGTNVFGRALEAASGDGKYILMQIRPEGLLTIPA